MSTSIGADGEALARTYLEAKGMRFLAKNYKRRHGEIDLIMQDGSFLVFVEVKTRRDLFRGTPAEAVTAAKQKHLRWCAEVYYAEHELEDVPARFDVVEVLLSPGRQPLFRHIRDAF